MGSVRALVTAGPTREHLDDVRFLSNGSTGRMGFALAEALVRAGHQAVLVAGPTALPTPPGVTRHDVTSAEQMLAAAAVAFRTCDICFAAAAVSDHRPVERQQGKPAKQSGRIQLELEPTPDVVATLARTKGHRTVVGFALEAETATPEQALARARAKLMAKQLDLIVLNRAAAIGSDENEVTLLFAGGATEAFSAAPKHEIAGRLVARAVALHQARNRS